MDLQNYESSILSVANIEGIDLASKIALAQEDIANQLMMFLLRRLPIQDLQWTLRRSRGVSDVVVTAPLRQWHAHKTLALLYRDAYNNQLNDRYKAKWNEYEQLAKASAHTYFQIGVGVAADPIPRPASPLLSTIAGPASGGTYFVAITWISRVGQESSPSNLAQITMPDSQQLVVSASGSPGNAAGWNAYVGASPNTVSLQNDTQIPINSTWTLTSGLKQGNPAGEGQQPTWFFVDHRITERG